MTNTAWLGSIVCAQMLQLVKFGIVWICGELEQIVNIPVTQIVEEDHRGEYSSSTECGRDRRGEQVLE